MRFPELFLALMLVVTGAGAQLKLYEDSYQGGVTAGGYSPGTGISGPGNFSIHIAPGSTIRKAYLLCGRQGPLSTVTVALNGNNITFDASNAFTSFYSMYGGNGGVQAADITALINPSILNYTLDYPGAGSTNFTDFYMYVAYENPSMPVVNTAIFLNTYDFADSVTFTMNLTVPIKNTLDVGLSVSTGYMCNWSSDGEYIFVDSTYIGKIGGSDINSAVTSCGGTMGSFYYEGDTLNGLNDDLPDLAMDHADALSNINSLMAMGDTTLTLLFQHDSNGSPGDNSVWLAVLAYGRNIIPTIANFCFGDTTLFSVAPEPGLAATSWDFGDPLSGLNNFAYVSSTSHVFTAPGTYLVTTVNYYLTAPNDTALTEITIHDYPVVSLGNDTSLCNGASLLLSLDTGYTGYQWSTGATVSSITVTAAGTYIATVSNYGCMAGDSIVINSTNCSPLILLASSDTSFCEKKCIDFFDLSTNNPTTWQWYFPGADSTSSTLQNPTNICYNSYGSFNVTLIACNGLGCDTLIIPNFINEYPIPVVTITQSNDTLFASAGFTYQWWSVDSGIIAGATNSYFIPQQGGNYYVVGMDTVGCSGTSNVITITGINTPGGMTGELSVLPNPSAGSFTIQFNATAGKSFLLQIINPIGQVIKSVNGTAGNQNKISMELSNVAGGMYSIELITTGKVYRQKLLLK